MLKWRGDKTLGERKRASGRETKRGLAEEAAATLALRAAIGIEKPS